MTVEERLDEVDEVEVPSGLSHLRRFALDGRLLLFERDSGLTALCEGPETAHLRQGAPRVVQFAITNHCNLACGFCSRDTAAESAWDAGGAFTLLAELARAGVLEVAFGGGEPLAFRGFDELVRRLHAETELAVSLTTNGLALTRERLHRLHGSYGQIRLSLYDDNDWRTRVALLSEERARFGVNWLLGPANLHELEARVLELAALGCRDVLLLSYNGAERDLHLDGAESDELGRRVALLARALANRLRLKLSVCWGERLEPVPRLFPTGDCGAGRDFVVLTSDRKLRPCSFHHVALPISTAADVLAHWREARELASAARIAGCARAPAHGFDGVRA